MPVNQNNKFNLEERFIDFSVLIIKISESLSKSRAGQHLSGQIIRSGTSPALNYAEAQAGESRKDFIHKLKIALKELRETYICLKIIKRANIMSSELLVEEALSENNELISILVKSISTAQKNLK